jgi:hypothetical protein
MILDASLVRVLIGCVLVRVVTELNICHVYKSILRTIKVAIHNILWASNFIAQYSKNGRMSITP